MLLSRLDAADKVCMYISTYYIGKKLRLFCLKNSHKFIFCLLKDSGSGSQHPRVDATESPPESLPPCLSASLAMHSS
jgi:hypothetical protein